MQAIRRGDWRAVRHGPDRPVELDDLSRDFGESGYVSAAHPDVAAGIEAHLQNPRTESPHWPLNAQ
jgi:hypothetical protein